MLMSYYQRFTDIKNNRTYPRMSSDTLVHPDPETGMPLNQERVSQSWVYEHFRDVVEEHAEGDLRIGEILDDIKERHAPTYRHSLRVGMLPAALSETLPDHIDEDTRKELTIAGALHDVGKSCNDHILHLVSQPRELREDEKDHVKHHAELGAEYLSYYYDSAGSRVGQEEHEGTLSLAAKIAKYHHSSPEKTDDPDVTDNDWEKILLTKVGDIVDALCDPEREGYRTKREVIESAEDAYEIVRKALPEGKDEILGIDVQFIVDHYWNLLQRWHQEG